MVKIGIIEHESPELVLIGRRDEKFGHGVAQRLRCHGLGGRLGGVHSAQPVVAGDVGSSSTKRVASAEG